MGYEAVRPTGRRGRLPGGYSVRGYHRFTDRPRRAPRYRSMYFHGHRSGSAEPILWVGGLIVGGVVILLVVLTLTHLKSSDRPANITVVPSTAAPAPERPAPAAPQPCYPFQPC
ncbi:hypothetical protein [Nocardia terpenica]|uniref:hypothetical protein n=1 Tax=Nocardia terpenica TaxID=455432 RepID=UPI0012FDCCCA|nr:hypothetical protein [Nocardia terpenica]